MITDHEEGIRQLKYAYDKGINVRRSILNMNESSRPGI